MKTKKLFVLGLLLAAVLIVPVSVSAQSSQPTIESLQRIVAQLQALLQLLLQQQQSQLSSSTTTPAMTILSPNGGETLPTGSTWRVRWDPQWMPTPATNTILVLFSLMDWRQVNPPTYYLYGLTNYLANKGLNSQGWVDWVVGQDVNPSLPPGKYKMRITCWDQNGPSQYCYRSPDGSVLSEDWSDGMFDIVVGTTTPPTTATVDLKVNGSNGPVSVENGETVKVSWQVSSAIQPSCNITSSFGVGVSSATSGSWYMPINFGNQASGEVNIACDTTVGRLTDSVRINRESVVPTVTISNRVLGEYGTSNAGDYKKRVATSFRLTANGGAIYVAKNYQTSLEVNTSAISLTFPNVEISPCSSCTDTASYFVIPGGMAREIVYTGEINNLGGTEGIKSLSVDKIYWSNEPNNLQRFSIVDGLEALRANIFLGAGNPTQPSLSLTSYGPPDGAIDARKMSDDLFREITAYVSSNLPWNELPAYFPATDFSLLSTRSSDLPITMSVESNRATEPAIAIILSRQLQVGERIKIRHNPSGSSICLGHLPGDISGNGTVTPTDQLDLIDAINGVKTLPSYSTDIDRNGVTNPTDILALVDGFNSGWLGETLPACPSSVGSVSTQTQLANLLSALTSALNQLRLLQAR